MGQNIPHHQVEHLYIHFPFCHQKCGYCSFYSCVYNLEQANEYFKTLLQEIEQAHKNFVLAPQTIYLGGGTPSLFTLVQLQQLLHILPSAPEITMEVNPFDVTLEKAKSWFQLGINRISMGAQSFCSEELKYLGRLHSSSQIYSAYDNLKKAGFTNISLDFIYALPEMQLAKMKRNIEKYIELAPQHISIYCLSLDKHVPLANDIPHLPSDDDTATAYQLICDELSKHDYKQYELSSFCKSGLVSQHNLAYWSNKSYLGFGPAAAGYIVGAYRYTNQADLIAWQADVTKQEISKTHLSAEDYRHEYIICALRKTSGLCLADYQEIFGKDFLREYQTIINKLKKLKMLDANTTHVYLLPPAYFVSNAVMAEFL